MAQQHYRDWAGTVNTFPAALQPNVSGETSQPEKINFDELIGNQLATLNKTLTKHETDDGKTLSTLNEAKLEVGRLATALNEAQRKLNDLVAQGSALTKSATRFSR